MLMCNSPSSRGTLKPWLAIAAATQNGSCPKLQSSFSLCSAKFMLSHFTCCGIQCLRYRYRNASDHEPDYRKLGGSKRLLNASWCTRPPWPFSAMCDAVCAFVMTFAKWTLWLCSIYTVMLCLTAVSLALGMERWTRFKSVMPYCATSYDESSN